MNDSPDNVFLSNGGVALAFALVGSVFVYGLARDPAPAPPSGEKAPVAVTLSEEEILRGCTPYFDKDLVKTIVVCPK